MIPDHESLDDESRLARALGDYLDRQAGEEAVDIAAFCAGYGPIALELRHQIEALSEIDGAVEGHRDLGVLPERLSGHKLLSEIGAGGMGRVFLAMDEGLNRKVAIKTLNRRYLDHPGLRARFMREARALAGLSHPNIVRIYNLGTPEEQPHFVMEYVEGVPLTKSGQALSFNQKADLLRKIALAVQSLHDSKLLHRDLKPGNILVGSDLEPKLLDFGLALQVGGAAERLTLAGDVMGTPDYLSPEQATAQGPLDARSDVFSLGTIFYELLTGAVPFSGDSLEQQIGAICGRDPVLPKRLCPGLPGDLQNVCMKALEKDPRNRYQSAREMVADLERFLAGEAVFAAPAAYSRLMAGKIPQHLAELEAWKNDNLLSDYEFDSFRRSYDRLVEREDAWIMETRRLSLPQVSLYLGAWMMVVAAALLVVFRYTHLAGTPAVLVTMGFAAPSAWIGLRYWNRGQLRIAVAYLLAFCLLLPVALQVAMNEYGLASYSQGDARELFGTSTDLKGATNWQLWWSLLLSLPAYYWLRKFTRSDVFSLVLAVMGAQFCIATLLLMGLKEWLNSDNPGKAYLYLIPCALLFFLVGLVLERFKLPNDARYFYPLATAFTWAALTGLAAQNTDYAEKLKSVWAATRGQPEYLFILNAGIYFVLQNVLERFSSPHLRNVAKSFRFLIPGHVMIPLYYLGQTALDHKPKLISEAHLFEALLPATACAFVFLSIPKQMKNFLVSGLVFLAVGIVGLEQDWLKDRASWPLVLLLAGFAFMLAAANHAFLKIRLRELGSEQESEEVPDWRGFRDFALSGRFDSSSVQSADAGFAESIA